MSSLQYSTTRDLDEATKLAHQGNVRLFIKLNFNHFVMENCCMVTNTLKFVCICSDYDDFEVKNFKVNKSVYSRTSIIRTG